MSPTTDHASIVTARTPPYSSTTIAMWLRSTELAQQHVEALDSGTNTAG
jgi:hypothetical protein